MKILVTGGTGFIGSHTVVELIKENYEVVIVDNLCNSDKNVVDKINKITNIKPKFYDVDLRDKTQLFKIMNDEKIEAVIHFAGLKSVGESVADPLSYYDSNLISTIVLLENMKELNIKNFIFSSSATVYGNTKNVPVKETEKVNSDNIINPYGRTKLIIEDILKDYSKANNDMNITILRYFNPVGGHESGYLGESPKGIPNNLMPIIIKAASKELDSISIFGNDYNTSDGTGVRDFIHVCDLAKGHIQALKNIKQGINIYNLGTGVGYSVLEMIKTFEKVNNIEVPYKFIARREGDIEVSFADASKAKKELNWEAKMSLEDMCRDSWNYKQNEVK